MLVPLRLRLQVLLVAFDVPFPNDILVFLLFSNSVISLNTKVDYEQDTSFQFTVHATDNAGGTQMTGSAIVTIIVEDSNEHPPIFVDCFSPPLPFEVSEASDPDELVAKVIL
ncbi:Protocadherin Fat 2 [Oopsacas minuta]|uniref:Protocadherin Fat 2 n=1 Tax=Oopsacas minuta TaxID=111878 RepID=A0AAV7K7L7_9METZ|nr:Protocadherin Fat 2 [Oopsacas minuta]